jgi:ParB family chromosome partitioning protein
MATRKALGRGLSALIPDSSDLPPPVAAPSSTREEQTVDQLHITADRIVPNPRQPRKHFSEREVDELAASIREHGILQPLVVRRQGEDYELIIGERRWRAAQRAGVREVPAVILDATDRAVVEMALVENVQRADLNPIELAMAFRALIEEESMTQDEVGRRVGLDRSTVANHLRLLELPDSIQEDLIDGSLTMGHAKAILQAPVEQRVMVRDRILRAGSSVRDAEDLTRRVASKRAQRKGGPSRDIHLVDLEEQLQRGLSTKVRIVGRPDRGRIEIHYRGQDEMNRLADSLLGDRT